MNELTRKEFYDNLSLDEKLKEELKTAGFSLRFTQDKKSGQKRILTMLSSRGPMNQRELTQLLNIQPGSASELLRKLEDADLIERHPDEKDRRGLIVSLTEDGQLIADHEKEKDGDRGIFAVLSDDEKQTLADLLQRLNEDWAKKFPPKRSMEHPDFPDGPMHHGPHGPMDMPPRPGFPEGPMDMPHPYPPEGMPVPMPHPYHHEGGRMPSPDPYRPPMPEDMPRHERPGDFI